MFELFKSWSIAISETRMTLEKGTNFDLEGYEENYVNRKNKKVGGVALFVDKNLTYKVVEKIRMVVDNILECITIRY